jgi:hypothetical protein
MTDALVHLRVPAALKARWVRESRAAGMRLTDWIVQRVEAQAMTTEHVAIGIPAGMKFWAFVKVGCRAPCCPSMRNHQHS